jgi:hypothetical protein
MSRYGWGGLQQAIFIAGNFTSGDFGDLHVSIYPVVRGTVSPGIAGAQDWGLQLPDCFVSKVSTMHAD